MSGATLTRIMDMTRVACPGALEGMMRLELSNMLKEFFRRSNIWLMELVVSIVPTTNDYYLQTGLDANVIRLMGLSKPQYPPTMPPQYVQPADPNDPPQFLQLYTSAPYNQTQSAYSRVPRDGGLLNVGSTPILRIHWNPGSNDLWIATVSLNISENTDDNGLPCIIPNWILEKFYDYFTDGLIGKMMMQPNKPYFNEKGASYHMRKFHEGVGLARTETRNFFTYGGQSWMYPQTFSARHPRVQ